MIDEIRSLDRNEMFKPKPKKRKSFFKKLMLILGYGKKR